MMKKKSVVVIIASALVLVALVALLVFVFSGDPQSGMKTVELKGTWKVAAYFAHGVPTLPEDEYMVFTEDSVVMHRDGVQIATSTYSVTNGASLKLPDVSRKYTVERCTNDYIRLCEKEGVYMDLIRYPNDDLSDTSVDKSKLYGTWNVSYRNTSTPISDEVIVFTEDTFEDYRNGSKDPVVVANYTWTAEGCLFAEKIGMEIQIVQFSDDVMFFIETKTGLVWALSRAS